jgi:hypothetical protein
LFFIERYDGDAGLAERVVDPVESLAFARLPTGQDHAAFEKSGRGHHASAGVSDGPQEAVLLGFIAKDRNQSRGIDRDHDGNPFSS